jgi:predicted  nucleic acid-binding Zn-ribbon protein
MRLEEEDSLAKQKPAIEQSLKSTEADRAMRLRDIEAAEAEAKAQLARLEAERAAELAELPPVTRQRYERIHSSREGRAVVPVVKNACGGCFRAQPPQMLQEIRRAERLLVCDGCGRILIQPPGEA